MASYQTTLWMKDFKGLYQDGDGVGTNLSYAVEAVNFSTEGGVLQSAARHQALRAMLNKPIGTLMRLHRRFHTEATERDMLVAAAGGQLYGALPGASAWTALALPEGMTGYQRDDWSWATYEINPPGSDAPVDVLLLSNALDGMFCVRGDTMAVARVDTPAKFGVIARYAERIWGGAIADDPDMLAYSAPFDPFNWAQNSTIPEDGAGDIRQPSWDGDSFAALTPFGAQLIAMKRQRVWRILGADPGEYLFRGQFGGGALAADTVAVDNERILMLGAEGLLRYDGLAVAPFGQPYAKGIFARMNAEALDGACACMYKEKYFCALPLDGAMHNNAVLVYDTRENTWLLREGLTVQAFLPTEGALYYTSATEPGCVWRWAEDAFLEGAAAPARWVSAWQHLGAQDIEKGGFTLYLAPEAQSSGTLRLTIRTECGARTKLLRMAPGGRQRRLVFGLRGRRFRVEMENWDGTAFRLVGGVQVEVELDAR
ncbi:MAG: hypothetical protein LBN04_05825 [Oscillospiraceae bacterium]|jgi:hypothetical protein|nr:hypothetical protein [Oscillospiraceae bacterium]